MHLLRAMLITLLTAVAATASFTIQFDPPSLPNGSMQLASWLELDMMLTTPQGFRHADSGLSPTSPDNGSAYAQFARMPAQQPLLITNVNAKTFDLLALDVAEYSMSFTTSSIPVTGHKPDGSTVSALITIDGIIDGTGPQQDFQTYLFGGDFCNLTHAEIHATGYSLDNLVGALYVVPEAGSCALMLAGLVMLSAGRRTARRGGPAFALALLGLRRGGTTLRIGATWCRRRELNPHGVATAGF